MKKIMENERGSLALEHVLFIAAIVVAAGAVLGFYGELGTYFNSIDVGDAANPGGILNIGS